MDEQNQNKNIEPTVGVMSLTRKKRTWWKYAIALCAFIIIVFGGSVVWYVYFSPEAEYRREVEQSALELPSKMVAYEKAMSEDVYGGKTPEETLQMFIEALRQGNVELASRYYALDNDTAKADPDRLENLRKAKNEGRIAKIVDLLSKVEPAGSPLEGYYGFKVKDDSGGLIADVDMKLNKYSGVWKIESL